MSQLTDEIDQLDLNAPDVKSSEMLQSIFQTIDKLPPDTSKYHMTTDQLKRSIVAAAHPYKLSTQALGGVEGIVGKIDPNKDNVATGREIQMQRLQRQMAFSKSYRKGCHKKKEQDF